MRYTVPQIKSAFNVLTRELSRFRKMHPDSTEMIPLEDGTAPPDMIVGAAILDLEDLAKRERQLDTALRNIITKTRYAKEGTTEHEICTIAKEARKAEDVPK